MKKGFTLAELLGVVVIIGLLIILAFPPIINQIKKMQSNVSDVSLEIIAAATNLYMDSHQGTYPLNPTTYCITLQQLVDDGKLEEPIINTDTGNIIALTKIVKVVVTSSVDLDYTLVDTCP